MKISLKKKLSRPDWLVKKIMRPSKIHSCPFPKRNRDCSQNGINSRGHEIQFGKKDGKIYLIDEIHTPDSSRYFYADGYEERLAKGERQRQLSKEFVREWLMENGFQGKEGQTVPEMTPEVVANITNRYIELYEHITGTKFEKADSTNILARIENNVHECLASLK